MPRYRTEDGGVTAMQYKQERQFGYLFAAVCTLVAFWPLWPLHMPNLYWLAAAGGFALAGLVWPRALSPLNAFWMKLGHALGWINARIILSVVFFLLVTPTAYIARLLGHDPLRLRGRAPGSYWVTRDANWDPKSLRDQF